MIPHPAHEEQRHPQLVPPFGHFQGFSAPASSQRNINNACTARLSDEMVSPRTVIPYHDHQQWELPRQLVERLSEENTPMPSTCYSSPQRHASGLVHNHEHHRGLPRPERAQQLSEPPMYITPPPQYYLSPENAPPPALGERQVSVMPPPREAPTRALPVPVQHFVSRHNTIRVPSNSDVSDGDQQPRGLTTAGRRLTASGNGEPTPVSDVDDDAGSTIYPYDSTTASSSISSRTAHGKGALPISLEEAVVEVHNTCLAATQRYLDSLRINWELRHGREILPPPSGLAGPLRRLRDRTCARGSPYPLLRRRSGRALSDNSGLEYMRGLRPGGGADEEGEDGGSQSRRLHSPACPIPTPTDSLLQNTSRICELVWRRARRDREDVLGAEAGGARRVALLVERAEAVVLCGADEWDEDPEGRFYAAWRAGRDFCRELGDSSAVERVDRIKRGEV